MTGEISPRAIGRPPASGESRIKLFTPHPLNRGRGGSGFVTINAGDGTQQAYHPADVG